MCILSALCQRSKTNELTSAVGSDVGGLDEGPAVGNFDLMSL